MTIMWLTKRKLYVGCRYLGFAIAIIGSVSLVRGLISEFSTRNYLKGFAQAIVPSSLSPEQRAERLLRWMRTATEPRDLDHQDNLDVRDPVDNLNNRKLLEVCGSSVNAYINLADAVGLQARPLILARPDYAASHVVAEVYLEGRWVVIDATFRRIMRDARGRLLTREDLRDPQTLRVATAGLAKYLPTYTYDRTTRVHLEKLPYLGGYLRRFLNQRFPHWEDSITPWFVVTERRTTIRIATGALSVFLGLLLVFLCNRLRDLRSMYRTRGTRRPGRDIYRKSDELSKCK